MKKVIFININQFIEDVCWRIFHEICHLFCGHTKPNKEQEEFCNDVATEAITPMIYFKENEKTLKEYFKNPLSKSPHIAH